MENVVEAAMAARPLILIVATQARNGELMQSVLEQAGYAVVVAQTTTAWEEALLTCPAVRLALVDMSGLRAGLSHGCAALREHGILFVLIASRNESGAHELALQFGARGVLMKPLTPAKLLEVVRAWVAQEEKSERSTVSPGVAKMDGGVRVERVALLLESSENARLLRAWLEPRYQVVTGAADALLEEGAFDLGMLDAITLTRWASVIQALRHREAPIWLPFLLLTPRHELRLAAQHMWQTVDELILMPVEKLELQARVEILLRARRLSVELSCRYQRLFDGVPIGLYRATPEGRLITANPAFLDMLKAPTVEAIPPLGWYVDAEDHGRLIERLDNQPKVYGVELRLHALDGEVFWGRCSLQGLRDSAGHLVALEGAIENADEIIRAREERERWIQAMADETRRIQQILATVPEAVILLETAGRILLANANARAILPDLSGIQGEGEIVTRLGDRSLQEILTSPPVRGLWHEVKSGQRHYEMLARPVEGLSAVEAQWVLVIKDVTQEVEIRTRIQQQERLAAVGQLAAGIAHDFNNIMAVITLYAQLLERASNLDARQRENALTIKQQADHATRLIQQILDFSRRSILERRPFDLLPFIKEQAKLLERTLPEMIRVHLDYRDGEYRINADPTSLQQMLMNLAINARDAMPDGGTLTLKLEHVVVKAGEPPAVPDFPEIAVGAWIRLTVQDTGTGIAPEIVGHIFEPFFTTKAPGKGSGLGLAQVHGIVAQHDGHITLETEIGKGTAFHIYFPALEVSPVLNHVDETALPLGHGEWILLVEDNATVRRALQTSLEQLNYHVLTAVDGIEALKVIKEQDAQLSIMLSDVVMPGMGGIALVRQLRKTGWRKPIVMLTGHALDENLEALRTSNLIQACITKPVVLEELAQVLNDLL